MSDPTNFFSEMAATARGMANDAASVAREASTAIDNNGEYGVAALVRSMNNLVDIALDGGMELAKRVGDNAVNALTNEAQERARGPMILADHIAAVAARMVRQAGLVAEDVSDKIDERSFTAKESMKSMTKLADIAIIGGMDIAETAMVGPARYSPRAFESDPFTVKPADYDRQLSIAKNARLTRPGTADPIPDDRITFVPKVLKAGDKTFHMHVNEDGLPSGIYTGHVLLTRVDPPGGSIKTSVAIRL